MALDAAIASSAAQRDSDHAAALAAYRAGVVDAEAVLLAAQDAAYEDYALAIAPANVEWDTAEAAAWSAYLAAKEAADVNFVAAEAVAWDNYVNGVALIESELALTEAAIEAQYASSVVSAALSAWQAAEAAAWDDYTTALAALPGSPEVGVDIESPPALPAVDGSSGEEEAEVYDFVEAWDGPRRAARKVTAQSAVVTVRAANP